MSSKGKVYLIHIDQPIAGHASHYLGWSKHFDQRIEDHRNGNGAALMAEVHRQGIGWNVVRTWSGTRKDERRLKNRKNAARLCPVCNPDHWKTNAKKLR